MRRALAGFAAEVDVATYEFENIPTGAARALAEASRSIRRVEALETAQDRLAREEFIARLAAAARRSRAVDDRAGLDAALGRIGTPGDPEDAPLRL